MTPTPKELRDLTSETMDEFPLAKIGLDPLPSGVRFLDVELGRRRFCLEYHPTRGTGISEITSATTPFDSGHEHSFNSVREAAVCLKSILAEAAKTEADHMPKVMCRLKKWRGHTYQNQFLRNFLKEIYE